MTVICSVAEWEMLSRFHLIGNNRKILQYEVRGFESHQSSCRFFNINTRTRGKSMAKQQVKSGLAGKLGGNVQATEIEVKAPGGGANLPPGIENGIAELVDCRFSQYKDGKMAGEYFFLAAGVVLNPDGTNSPWLVDGKPVDGLRTQIMEPMCDTPDRGGEKARKTQQEHYNWVVNQMGLLLGKKPGDKFTIEPEDLEAVAEQIKDMKPCFRFRTFAFDREVIAKKPNGKYGLFTEDSKGNRKPSKNLGEWPTEEKAREANKYAGRDPMVFETWAGACEDPRHSVDSTADSRVQDDTPDELEVPTDEPVDESVNEEQDVPFGDDLDDIVAAANGDDADVAQQAIDKLGKLAQDVGYTLKQVTAAKDWESVAQMIRDKQEKTDDEPVDDGIDWAAVADRANSNDKKAIKQLNDATKAKGLDPDDYGSYEEQAAALSGGVEEKEEEPEQIPAKGEVWTYKAPGTKKAVDVEIVSVNAKKRTVKLKDSATKKDIPGDVSWDAISA